MANETKLFPRARFVPEGSLVAPNGAAIITSLIDLGGLLRTEDVCIAKWSRPVHSLKTAPSIRLSRPDVFRDHGEVLLQDPQEGRVAKTKSKTSGTSNQQLVDDVQQRLDALNVAAKLNTTIMNLSASTKDTQSESSEKSITFGSDWLIYCTAMHCSDKGDDARKEDFSENYSCCTTIYRPTQFAQALGMSVCEHVGAFGKPSPSRQTLSNFLSAETERHGLVVVHGPTLYVDDPYAYVSEAKAGWEMLSAMIFLKSQEHAREEEYRFAVFPVPPTTEAIVDLPVSGAMMDCLSPPAMPRQKQFKGELVVVPEDGAAEIKTSVPTQKHTYRRRLTRTKKSSLKVGDVEQGGGEQQEEVVEETVVSPEEIQEAFRSKQEKHPDIIIFQQWGNRIHYVHEAFHNVETERWRLETVRRVDLGPNVSEVGEWPDQMSVPSEVAYEKSQSLPWHPELILEYCLEPSLSRAPGPYGARLECTTEEFEHVLGCVKALEIAVELVPEAERERAAAAAWYALGFIEGLTVEFGPIVESVCIIRGAVAVVELVRARFSGAVGWATFSGSGTYTLYIRGRNAEEFTFPGRFSRPQPMGSIVYGDALHQNGWHRKEK